MRRGQWDRERKQIKNLRGGIQGRENEGKEENDDSIKHIPHLKQDRTRLLFPNARFRVVDPYIFKDFFHAYNIQ